MNLKPARPVYIRSWGSVVGKKEHEGPLGELFDRYDDRDTFGKDTFEKTEAEMQRLALDTALTKGNYRPADITTLFAGDLVNQCIASHYGLIPFKIPFVGLFGACSTAAEGLMLSSLMAGAYANRCASVTSSHFCTAERQFRYPLEYGGQRPPTAQWTVTGAGAFVCTSVNEDFRDFDGAFLPRIVDVMSGRMVDGGINDANNMGAAMAPAALDTLERYFANGHTSEEFDLIITGDLGMEGNAILTDLSEAKGLNISSKLTDCGKMIYRMDTSDCHAGGSGCGCSAVVLAADLLGNIVNGTLQDVLFIGTGALMNSMSLYQGQTIPGIAHAVHIHGEARE